MKFRHRLNNTIFTILCMIKIAFNTLKLIAISKPRKTIIIEDNNGISFAEYNSRIERWTE